MHNVNNVILSYFWRVGQPNTLKALTRVKECSASVQNNGALGILIEAREFSASIPHYKMQQGLFYLKQLVAIGRRTGLPAIFSCA